MILGDTVCAEIRSARRDESASFCGFPVTARGSGETLCIAAKYLATAVLHKAERAKETRFVGNFKTMAIEITHSVPARGGKSEFHPRTVERERQIGFQAPLVTVEIDRDRGPELPVALPESVNCQGTMGSGLPAFARSFIRRTMSCAARKRRCRTKHDRNRPVVTRRPETRSGAELPSPTIASRRSGRTRTADCVRERSARSASTPCHGHGFGACDAGSGPHPGRTR